MERALLGPFLVDISHGPPLAMEAKLTVEDFLRSRGVYLLGHRDALGTKPQRWTFSPSTKTWKGEVSRLNAEGTLIFRSKGLNPGYRLISRNTPIQYLNHGKRYPFVLDQYLYS
jgi:hypothetical protein